MRAALLLLAACRFAPGPSETPTDGGTIEAGPTGAVAVDRFSTGLAAYRTELTHPHTIGPGADRLLLAAVSTAYAGTTVVAMSFENQPMTLVGAADTPALDGRVEMWSLVAPSPGTGNLVMTFSDAASSIIIGVGSYTNVDPAAPLGTFASEVATTGEPSITVASAAGELVVDVVLWDGGYSTLAPGADQLPGWNEATGDGDPDIIGAGSRRLGAAAVTMTWDVAIEPAEDYWAIGAVSIKPR